MDELESNLKDLKRLGIKIILFTGGEPLLYPHIVEALKLAKKYGFYTSIVTNCTLYPKYAPRLKGLVDILQFSFDSVDENEHNRIRGINCYNKVIESLKIAKEIKQEMNLIHTVTNENAKNIPKMIAFAKKNNCILCLNPCFEYFGNESIPKKVASDLRKYFKEPCVVFDLAYLKLTEKGGNNITKPVCKAISQNIVISPDNFLVLPCYHHSSEKIKISNNLFEIYNSDRVKKLMKQEGRFAFCKNCQVYCYIGPSLLFTKYSYLSIISIIKYLIERTRTRIHLSV